jgi:hypothetical protein
MADFATNSNPAAPRTASVLTLNMALLQPEFTEPRRLLTCRGALLSLCHAFILSSIVRQD